MFLPSQVLPYLQHREKAVRELAIRYLANAHDPSPATADDLWRVIEKFGAGERGHLYYLLAEFHQTEQSVDLAIKTLGESSANDEVCHPLEAVLADMSYATLLQARDAIEECTCISEAVQKHLQQRIRLSQTPRNELLDQLEEVAENWNREKPDERPVEDERLPSRLVEALARHPESAPWAISALNDESVTGSWLETWAVDLLGRMHFRPAADLIVQKLMADVDADSLIETSVDALGRIGSADVVRIIRERYSQMPWGIRLHAAEVVSRIKLPQSEAVLLAMLNAETDRSLRTNHAEGMCKLCVSEPASLSKLREIVNDGKWDLTCADLDADVAALFTIVGHEVPELSRWRAAASDTTARAAARKHEYSKLLSGNERASEREMRRLEAEETPWDEEVPPWEAAKPDPTTQTDAPVAAAPKTIRREVPKVGRNDPCPCGSGKKYKKCCGK